MLGGSRQTDLGFSYSARGEVTDVYESTPNSGGYYQVSASYWANGLVNVMNGVGLPQLTYSRAAGLLGRLNRSPATVRNVTANR